MSTLDELKEKLHQELEQIYHEIETARDEMKLHSSLAKQELRDELNLIENKYQHYKTKLDKLRKEAEFNNQTTLKELQKLGNEIIQAYRRIKNALNR